MFCSTVLPLCNCMLLSAVNQKSPRHQWYCQCQYWHFHTVLYCIAQYFFMYDSALATIILKATWLDLTMTTKKYVPYTLRRHSGAWAAWLLPPSSKHWDAYLWPQSPFTARQNNISNLTLTRLTMHLSPLSSQKAYHGLRVLMPYKKFILQSVWAKYCYANVVCTSVCPSFRTISGSYRIGYFEISYTQGVFYIHYWG